MPVGGRVLIQCADYGAEHTVCRRRCAGSLPAYDVRQIGQASPAIGRFIEVSGGRLHLVETGRSDKYPVVLLHGASVNLGDMMLALSGELSAKYRVIAVDRPGHGWSDRPGGSADASPMVQARLIRQALDRMV